ncbi:MAG: DNA polymerase III subunit gamma/tau [Chitinophagaceae bacterium]|jgi:DNA polymerase-3 subunit gamma/tau|nr:DNA polymerase III subunit gamma/tau [Chitinophagaceae bacterium]MCF8421640.1 DNA polymerase III subunit gamma/tau [Chitinophagaceae bacterium]
MENFIVSARKYRPQNFNTVVGQSHITTTLKNAILNQHLAHAFLFCGPRGVGKTTCARILAKTINCTNITKEGEACNQCESCVSFEKGASLNIHELDAASNNSVDDIRTLVEQVRFAPQAGKYKVYIVDEVHMLSTSAFNAFLKTLEEPPPYAIFILATTEKHKILPTILSRCQIFDFKRIVPEDTVKHLEEIVEKEHIKAERNALQLIAQKSEGCMRDALSILDKIVSFSNGALTYENTLEHLNILDEGYFFKLLTHLTEQDLTSAMLLYDEINQKGFEGDTVLYGMAAFIRNILVCKDKASAHLLESIEGWRDQYLAAAEKIGTPYLVSALNILNESEIQFKMARNKRLHVELALIKLNFLQQAIELSMEDGQLVKKKLVDAHYPIRTKKIIPLSNIVVNAEAKLVIETAAPAANPISNPVAPTKVATTPPKATTPPVQNTQLSNPTVNGNSQRGNASADSGTPTIGGKKSLLAVLQQKYGNDYNIEEVKDAISLNIETLQACWNDYAVKMEKELKHSVAGTFKIATLQIEDPTHFTITVPALTAQKFVEQERMRLMETIWERFQNRAIQFSILVDAGEKEDVPLHLKLNSKQKFDHIAKQYPLVQQLKERLNLEVNF